MPEPRAQRTLVKSPPEIWAEVSDVSTLARHLGEFGEIRITRLEAETTVVWEGDRARGTVELEASGWGTKVTITAEAVATDDAEVVEAEAVATEVVADVVKEEAPAEAEAAEVVARAVEAEVVVEKEAAPIEAEAVEDTPAPRRGFFARLRRRRAPEPAVAIREPEPVVIETNPEPVAIEPEIIPTVAAPEPVAEVTDAPEIAEPELDGEITATATAAIAAFDPEQVEAVLVGVLDDLGSAHHRPFSRG
ncbi:MAG TPA: hypothetical protein VFY45_21035 [Baekduia sp.]|nr:hypothetical protein [Baekduia sp.]